MRTFKTSKKKRTNYTYYPVAGASITITPDEVGENWIEMLHDDDNDLRGWKAFAARG